MPPPKAQKSMTYLDNSVLSEIREKPHCGRPDQEKEASLEQILSEFHLSLDNTIITDNLYIESIGLGKIKKTLSQGEALRIIDEAILNSLQSNKSLNELDIRGHLDNLENSLRNELKELFSQEDTLKIAENNLREYPFPQKFKIIETKIIDYGRALSTDNQRYNSCINNLTYNSLISFGLSRINLKGISPCDREKAKDLFLCIFRILTSKIRSIGEELFDKSLILFTSALRTLIRAEKLFKNTDQGGDPLLRIINDLADSEMAYYVLHGYSQPGNVEEGIIPDPVTVVSQERYDTVRERLYFHIGGLNGGIGKRPPPMLMCGRHICINFNGAPLYQRIEIEDLIAPNGLQKLQKVVVPHPLDDEQEHEIAAKK